MVLQLECLGVILPGPVCLAKTRVGHPQLPVATRKIRIKLERALKVRKGIKRPFFIESLIARLYSFRASSEGVVARASGTSNIFTEARDSPSLPRSLEASASSASSTFSLDAAKDSSSASVSPSRQFTAFNPST